MSPIPSTKTPAGSPGFAAAPSGAAPAGLNPRHLIVMPDEIGRLFSNMNPEFVPGHGLAVAFMGSHYGEGVSTIARDFALTAAQHLKGTVLLLDFDWDRDSHFNHLQQALATGGADREAESAVDLDIDLSPLIGLSGPPLETPLLSFHAFPDLGLMLGRTRSLLRDLQGRTPCLLNRPDIWDLLRSRFMMIVVDCPPSSQSFDGTVLSGAMDAVILVVGAEFTRAPVVEDLRDRLLAQGAPLAGVVLNRRRFYIPKWAYRLLDRL